jgi:type IV secretion system protein VirB8
MSNSYFKNAQDWHYEVHESLKRSHKIAWSIAVGASLLAMMSIFALVLVLPLKEYAPYVITVEKSTGFVEVTKGLHEGHLSQDESVTISNLARYVMARETFDAADFKEKFKFVTLYSAEQADEDYRNIFSQNNPDNPVILYGHEAARSVEIKNVTFLNDKKDTAAVRFLTQTTYKNSNRSAEDHYMAILKFRYVRTPEKLKNRFINPLGFQVISYRRDTEVSD